MKLEQHFYTSGKTEFSTVAATDGLTRAERIVLENHSLYILPASLLYQENVEPPTKYMYYPLGADRLVVGKAIYIGQDSLGRPGNYLFHNLIVNRDDLLDYSRINPVVLMKDLEQKGLFQDTAPETTVPLLDIPVPEFPAIEFPKLALQESTLSQLLYVCLNHASLQCPLMLHGNAQECLDFLEQLYPLLPLSLRAELSFDTYTYNVSLDLRVAGLPEEPEYRQHVPASLTIHVASLQAESSLETMAPSPYHSLVTRMISAGQTADLNTVYTLEHFLRRGEYDRFNARYAQGSQEIKQILLNFHRQAILDHIVEQQDTTLLQLLQADLTAPDLPCLSQAPAMVRQLVETEDPDTASTLADWLCVGKGDRASCYPSLFEFHSFWQIFLQRLTSQPRDILALVGPLKIFPEHYAPEYEESLLDAFFKLLPSLRKEKKSAKDLFKTLELFPQAESEEIRLLRTAVKCSLSREETLLNDLLAGDLSLLSDERTREVLNVIVRNVFRTKNDKDLERQLNGLFATARSNPNSLLILLRVIEHLECSKKVQGILKKIFDSVTKEELSIEIKSCIDTILKPPPSLFSRVADSLADLIKL